MHRKKDQRGLATVEFAMVGSIFLVVLFGIMEVGRVLFTWNTLTEVTRRGARQAVVCPINHSSIASAALFNNNIAINGLTTADIEVSYLDTDGNTVTEPADNQSSIYFVRVAINTEAQHSLFIPGMTQILTMPAFATTLPIESLGVSRDEPPQCNGTSS